MCHKKLHLVVFFRNSEMQTRPDKLLQDKATHAPEVMSAQLLTFMQ